MVPVNDAEYERRLAAYEAEMAELREQAKVLEEEVVSLRRRLQDAPKRVRTLEERLLETKGQLAQAVVPEREAHLHPAGGARAHRRPARGGRQAHPAAVGLRHAAGPATTTAPSTCSPAAARCGCRCTPRSTPTSSAGARRSCSTSRSTSCWPAAPEIAGEVVTLKERAGRRRPGPASWAGPTRSGWSSWPTTLDGRARSAPATRAHGRPLRACCSRSCPGPRSRSWCSRRCPTSPTTTSAASTTRSSTITDAVELPFLHQDLFAEHKLPAPKGILLYGPPGLRQDAHRQGGGQLAWPRRWPRSPATSQARSYFLNIKGPELLNKYVGETERQIRLVFQRAREKSEEGWPVIVFFDEMDSLFRTRGTGISSDMESTIVPQLLAEIDGVETLKNVIVIGASNREDLIDPAILRPGRLDVKIKIERPNEEAAAQIFARYLTADLPARRGRGRARSAAATATRRVQAMIERTVEEMYRDRRGQPVPRGHLPER